jgi:hypothetical protein
MTASSLVVIANALRLRNDAGAPTAAAECAEGADG